VLILIALGLVFFVMLFVGIWLGVCFLIGMKWRQVAGRYPATVPALGRPEGRGFVALRGFFLPAGPRYKRCLEVVPGAGGLYVAVKWPFNVAQEPMLVPWPCVRGLAWKEGGWTGRRYLEVDLALEGAVLRLDLPAEAEAELQRLAGPFLAETMSSPPGLG